MIHELRIYNINEDKKQTWLETFNGIIRPAYSDHAIAVPAGWWDPEGNAFIWFRLFNDADEQKTKHEQILASPQFKEAWPLIRACVAEGTTVRNMSTVLNPDFSQAPPLHELRIYDINPGKMEQWITLFKTAIIPAYQAQGVRIPAAWRHNEIDEFVWFRVFEDNEDQAAKHQAVLESTQFQAAIPEIKDCMANIQDVRSLNAVVGPDY